MYPPRGKMDIQNVTNSDFFNNDFNNILNVFFIMTHLNCTNDENTKYESVYVISDDNIYPTESRFTQIYLNHIEINTFKWEDLNVPYQLIDQNTNLWSTLNVFFSDINIYIGIDKNNIKLLWLEANCIQSSINDSLFNNK